MAGANKGSHGHAMCSCLADPVILRNIMQHFSTTELLKLSLVNKDFNGAARCVLRNQDNLIANLKSDNPCRTLAAFASDLQGMNVVPFSGMRIYLRTPHSPCQLSPPGAFDGILDRLNFKFFHVVTTDATYWAFNNANCPGYLFVQKVLQVFGRRLEEFTISPCGNTCFFVQLFENASFTNLKIFSFTEHDDEEENNLELVRTVVSIAPNLQELHIGWHFLAMAEEALGGSSAVLVNHANYNPLREDLPERRLSLLRLKSLTLDHIRDWSVTKFNGIVPSLLEQSYTTLTALSINLAFALPILSYEVGLENVTALKLYMDCRTEKLDLIRPCFLVLTENFDFTRVFPRLETADVENVDSDLDLTTDQIRTFIEQANAHAARRTPLPDRATNIKRLRLYDSLKDTTATFLAQLFPNVEALSVVIHREPEAACGLIWKHWLGLKELKIRKTGRSTTVPEIPCLDSVFCGIFPEEVAQLQFKDDEYLKSVNIVPVMPSLTCLKRLRTFQFIYSGWGGLPDSVSDDPTKIIFTQVTSCTAFARCPKLSSVTVETREVGYDEQ